MILEKYSQLQTQLPCLPYLVLLTTFIAGMMLGIMISALITQTQNECRIEYISRDEILAFEKARIARVKEQKLFFGKTREAINLIQNFAKTRTSTAGSHVIFTKGSFVRGKGVFSISEEVHGEVIKALRDSAVTSNTAEAENEETDSEDEHSTKGTISPAMKLLQQFDQGEKW